MYMHNVQEHIHMHMVSFRYFSFQLQVPKNWTFPTFYTAFFFFQQENNKRKFQTNNFTIYWLVKQYTIIYFIKLKSLFS